MPIKITASMVQRYESKRFGFNDPCIVCGGNFNMCGHDSSEVICRIRGLGAEGRERIRNAPEPEAEGVWGELEYRPEGYFYIERTKGSEHWPFNVMLKQVGASTEYEVRELTGDTAIGWTTTDEMGESFVVYVNGEDSEKRYTHLRPAVIHLIEEYNGV